MKSFGDAAATGNNQDSLMQQQQQQLMQVKDDDNLGVRDDRNLVIFIFSDSNSDTGAFYSGLGLMFGIPKGLAYFNDQPSGRLCDGQLVIDFICFENPVKACFSYGGPPYSYNPNITYATSWLQRDGVHDTEAATAIISSKIHLLITLLLGLIQLFMQ